MAAVQELDDMTNQEKDVRYHHVFHYFAQELSQFIVSDCGKSTSTNADYAAIKCSLAVSTKIRTAMKDADETLSRSPIASLLPAHEYREKLMVAGAKLLRKNY